MRGKATYIATIRHARYIHLVKMGSACEQKASSNISCASLLNTSSGLCAQAGQHLASCGVCEAAGQIKSDLRGSKEMWI